ncbi:MAG: YbaY family lipoprotein [Chloroflexota bacterium]
MPVLVTGKITLPADTPTFSNANVNIRMDSVGLMDAPADTLAETTLTAVGYTDAPLDFSLSGDIGEAVGTFNLWVHVDLSASGEIDKGDYVTKRTHPVNYEDKPVHVTVAVEKV